MAASNRLEWCERCQQLMGEGHVELDHGGETHWAGCWRVHQPCARTAIGFLAEGAHPVVAETLAAAPDDPNARELEHRLELLDLNGWEPEIGPPAGWRVCPECNGEGLVVYMDSGPDCDEHTYECTACERGLVRETPDDAGPTADPDG